MSHVFGRSISFSWTPHANGVPVPISGIVSARIYSDQPSESQIADSATLAGALERVTTARDEGDFEKVITFSALTDPTPHDGADYKTFYVVVNFRYESGGSIVFDQETLFVYRPDSYNSKISVTADDVLGLEPDVVRAGRTRIEIERMIRRAKEDVLTRIEAIGERERKRLFNLERLNSAVTYRAASLVCMSLYSQNAPHWLNKYTDRKQSYEQFFSIAKPGYDTAGTDSPSPDGHVKQTTAYIIR